MYSLQYVSFQDKEGTFYFTLGYILCVVSDFLHKKKHKNCLQVTSASELTKIPSEFKMQAQKQQLQWALVQFKTALD